MSIATFDVQNGSLTVNNSITREVCFTCYFLEGSQSQGCYIEYNSLITDYYSGNITIVRTSVNTSTASKCVTGIYTSNYNVTFYDMDYNNVPYTTEYAVKLTNLSVNGLLSSPTSFMPPSISTVVTLPPSSCTVCTSSKSSYYCLFNTYIDITTTVTTVGSVQGGLPLTIIIGTFAYKNNIIIVRSFLL